MGKIIAQRVTASVDDDFVIFIIGIRINKLWKVHKWLPVARAMPRMLKELVQQKDSPLLGYQQSFGRSTVLIQYWRSFEELVAYAQDRGRVHLPAWSAFNKAVASNGDVGIWHETYRVRRGEFECIYNNMPPHGLAAATQLVPVGERSKAAAERMEAS